MNLFLDGDYALGVIYRMPKGVERLLNSREGAPTCYKRDTVQLKCGNQTINAQAYFVVNKHLDEVKPDKEYYDIVLQGMKNRYPVSYTNKYFIAHCNQKFSMKGVLLRETSLYKDNLSKPMDQNNDGYLNRIINQMALHLGNGNNLVECIQPTPEMLRILVKLMDMQARGVLDYGHLIPRSLVNKLVAEFERLTGCEMERLPE